MDSFYQSKRGNVTKCLPLVLPKSSIISPGKE
jgi:hypothetical protein